MVRFITFEGGDGTGKSTQIRALENYLVGRAHSCVVTREPGGTVLGNLIRKMLLDVGSHEIASSAELFLYLADRAQHVSKVILPAIKGGNIVLCDRFTDSTVAYQGYGRGIDLSLLRQLNDIADRGVRPDLTFLLDCPAHIGLARTARRQRAMGQRQEDRFEREKIEFHDKVRVGFLEIARAEPKRFRLVDATRSIEEVTLEIKKIIDQEML
ncbi:MAG TPA: dTMP kinase [Candidatus Binatia bacterium]|jgi:dTMP kinase